MSGKGRGFSGRRKFLAQIGSSAGALALGCKLQAAASALPPAGRDAALDSTELGALKTLVGRLIPSEGAGDGAVDAHAHIYIDRALAGAYANYLGLYRGSLAALAVIAKAGGAKSIEDMSTVRLDALIADMEAGRLKSDVPGWADGGKEFFALLLAHTIEGTFGDPMYGGNHDFAGWRLMGYTGIQLAYSQAQQELNPPLTSENRSVADFGAKPR